MASAPFTAAELADMRKTDPALIDRMRELGWTWVGQTRSPVLPDGTQTLEARFVRDVLREVN